MAGALRAAGADTRTVDVSALLDAATLLYDGALVAERHAAVGAFIDAHPGDVDPSVRAIISAAAAPAARDHVADLERLDHYRVAADRDAGRLRRAAAADRAPAPVARGGRRPTRSA